MSEETRISTNPLPKEETRIPLNSLIKQEEIETKPWRRFWGCLLYVLMVLFIGYQQYLLTERSSRASEQRAKAQSETIEANGKTIEVLKQWITDGQEQIGRINGINETQKESQKKIDEMQKEIDKMQAQFDKTQKELERQIREAQRGK